MAEVQGARPRLSREEVAAKRQATQMAMAEARSIVRQTVESLESDEFSLDGSLAAEDREILEQRFVREMSLIAALHMGGAAETLAMFFYPGEEEILAGLLAAARKVGWLPRDHFSWHTPRGRKADGTTLAENLRSRLSHAEWEKLAALLPKEEKPKASPAESWDELFASVERPRKGFLALIIEWSEPARAKAEKSAETTPEKATKETKPTGGKLAAILGKKAVSTQLEAEEETPEPEPAKPKGLKAKLGGKKVAAAVEETTRMTDTELARRVKLGELSLAQALELRAAK